MPKRLTMDVSFEEKNSDKFDLLLAYINRLKPFMVNINEGKANHETSYIEARECNHDSGNTIPDKILDKWECPKKIKYVIMS